MNHLVYIKYQILCLLRSHHLLLIFQTVALQIMPIVMLWLRPFFKSEPLQIYISSLLTTAAMITASENIFAWQYGSVFLLYVTPSPLIRRLSLLLPLLYALLFVAVIEIVLFYTVVRITFTPEKHILFILCFLVGIAVAIYEALMISIYHAMPIKKSAFSFGEKAQKSKLLSLRRIMMVLLPTLVPTLVFYTIAQYSVAWFVFVGIYICAIYILFFQQMQAISYKAYLNRFHLYQSLKGLK